MREPSECCDSHIIITKLLNAVCTEITDECTNSNTLAKSRTNEPSHEPYDQSDRFADIATSERIDPNDNFDEFYTRGMNFHMHPNEAVLNGLVNAELTGACMVTAALCQIAEDVFNKPALPQQAKFRKIA